MRRSRSLRHALAAGSICAWPLGLAAQTGAVDRLEFDEFNTAGVITPELLIQGRAAGVDVIDDAGPGGGVSIRIRGRTSLTGSEPLFVVDGLPLLWGGGISAGRNPLAFVNPADVHSITILRDASATAIYGSRAANGVVLIETKGASGAGVVAGTRIDYAGSVSAAGAGEGPDMMSAERFRQTVAAYDAANGTSISAVLGDADTDWQDALQRTGIGHDHAIAFSGAGAHNSFRVSAGYLNQGGVVHRSAMERATLALNLAQALFDDRLRLSANLRGAHFDDAFAPIGVFAGAAAMAPTQPVRDDASPFGGYFEWPDDLAPNNPVAELVLTSDRGTTQRGAGTVEAAYRLPFLDAPRATVRLGHDVTTIERDASQPPHLRGQAERPNPGFSSRTDGSMTSTLLETFVDYRRGFGTLDADVMVGYAREQAETELDHVSLQGVPPTGGFGWQYRNERNLSSFFGRTGVSFRDRYRLTLSVRHDALVGPDRSATYPAVGIAWRLADESFMERFASIGELNLRASWGVTGSHGFGSPPYPSTYDIGPTMARYQFESGSPGMTLVDPDIEWEEVTSVDVGLDFGFAGGRVTGALDYYRETTENLIFPVPAPVFGVPLLATNIGSMANTGFELSLDAVLVKGGGHDGPGGRPVPGHASAPGGAPAPGGGLSWSVGFNAAFNSNELGDIDPGPILTGDISGFGNSIQVLQSGQPAHAFFVYRHRPDNPDHVDIDGDGDVDRDDLYVDADGNGFINFADRRPYGSPTPDWILGLHSRMTWQRFDLSLGLRAHLGHQVYDQVAAAQGHLRALTFTGVPHNLHESVLETGFETEQYFSEYYVQDASFLRLDDVTLGYTLTPSGTGTRVRVFGRAQNLFTLTEYRGIDPRGGIDGIDGHGYPRARIFTAGIDAGF